MKKLTIKQMNVELISLMGSHYALLRHLEERGLIEPIELKEKAYEKSLEIAKIREQQPKVEVLNNE